MYRDSVRIENGATINGGYNDQLGILSLIQVGRKL